MNNQCRNSEGFLLTPLCGFGNKFDERGIGDADKFPSQPLGPESRKLPTPACLNQARAGRRRLVRFITSLCRVTVSSKFSTFLSSTVECNGSASFSFFLCLLAFFK